MRSHRPLSQSLYAPRERATSSACGLPRPAWARRRPCPAHPACPSRPVCREPAWTPDRAAQAWSPAAPEAGPNSVAQRPDEAQPVLRSEQARAWPVAPVALLPERRERPAVWELPLGAGRIVAKRLPQVALARVAQLAAGRASPRPRVAPAAVVQPLVRAVARGHAARACRVDPTIAQGVPRAWLAAANRAPVPRLAAWAAAVQPLVPAVAREHAARACRVDPTIAQRVPRARRAAANRAPVPRLAAWAAAVLPLVHAVAR